MGINGVDGPAGAGRSMVDFEGQLSELGGDVNAQVAVMLLSQARENREAADRGRAAEEANLEAQEVAQVAAIHAQADDIRSAGSAALVGDLFSGGLSVLGGVVRLGGEDKPTPSEFDRLQARGAMLDTEGRIVKAGADFAGSVFNGAKSDEQAAESAAGHAADAAKRRLDDLKGLHSDARDLARAAIDFLRETTRTKGETDRTAISIRG
jgi:hypothetical protein